MQVMERTSGVSFAMTMKNPCLMVKKVDLYHLLFPYLYLRSGTHEMGFLNDRSNVDSLEYLEAAHMGVDSTEKVSANSAVEHLLGSLA